MYGRADMKNINKNAVQALWVDGKAFLTHKAIDNFTMGQGDFTIEVSFICKEVRDCLFYAQEQGFAFGIRNGLLYFELEGMGSITQKEGVAIDTDILLSASVSCREGKLSLYFEGLPIADQVQVTSEAVERGGAYVIGKELNGYVVDLRLRSCGMTDQEILSDNGMGLSDCESIEFWADFTTMQYRDKSKNKVGLSTAQGIAKCVNVTSCIYLEQQGGYESAVKTSYGETYTLLFKIYPQLESHTKMYVYSAAGSDGTIFSIGIESDSEGNKQIFVENGGEVYQCNSALPIMAWTDIGLRVETGNAQLYIDGIRQLEFAFSGKLDNISAIIGLNPEEKNACKDGFWGYLDYFAEFDCALSEEKIAYYAEEQPYIFDESINSLYAFYCGDPIDLLTGNMLLSIGSGKAVFEKELNNLSAPIGMDLRIPQEVCAEWQELDEYEQWATTAAMDMVRETYSQSMGLAIPEGAVPIEQTATMQIRQIYAEQIKEIEQDWDAENGEEKAEEFIKTSLSVIPGGVGIAVTGGITAASLGALATVAKVVVCKKAAVIIGGVLLVGGVIKLVVSRVLKVETEEKKKEPKRGRVVLESICCNHNGDPTKGSIHFHSDADLTEPKSMTYTVDNTSIDMLLITEELKELEILCVIKNVGNAIISGVFELQIDDAKGNESVTLAARQKKEVNIRLLVPEKIKEPLAGYMVTTAKFRFNDKKLYECTASIFYQQKLPIEPWTVHINEVYRDDIKTYPSLVFMKNVIFCQQQEIRKNLDDILNKLFDSDIFTYNSCSGYTYRSNDFIIKKFNKSICEKTEDYQKVNCTDCANIVCLIATQLGQSMEMNIIFGEHLEGHQNVGSFKCNNVIPIGKKEWEKEDFVFHQVAFISACDDGQFTKDACIYDLCLKIDKGSNPGKADGDDKISFLSGGFKANENVEKCIKIDEPYTKEYYLERLVESGQSVWFQSKGTKSNLYFDLDDMKYVDEISQTAVPLYLQNMRLKAVQENKYECKWAAPDGRRITWFRNVEHLPAGEYLASVLMRFSCRLTEKEAPKLGERVFYGPDLLITYFEGSAYAINCKDMAKAEEMARSLKNSIIQ